MPPTDNAIYYSFFNTLFFFFFFITVPFALSRTQSPYRITPEERDFEPETRWVPLGLISDVHRKVLSATGVKLLCTHTIIFHLQDILCVIMFYVSLLKKSSMMIFLVQFVFFCIIYTFLTNLSVSLPI